VIKLDLIEFSDYIRPKEIVDEVLKQNPNIKIPIPLSEIAKNIGIVDIDYRPLGNLEGALVANEYKTEGVILINNSKEAGTKERQRFTLGHEIGHFMIPRHGYKMSCSIWSVINIYYANIFSDFTKWYWYFNIWVLL
jgi:Zn-dependent peptidase ImmA (M78 family)